MAGVPVTVPTTGSTIAAENIGTDYYQMVKLVGGNSGSSIPIPGNASGLMVQATVTIPVAISGPIAVTNTSSAPLFITGVVTAGAGTTVVSVTGSVLVSGTVAITPTVLTVNTAATIAGASVVVGNLPTVDVTTTGAVAAGSTGLLVIVKAGSVAISNIAASQVLGTVIAISGVTNIASVGVVSTVGTVLFISGITALSTILNTIPVAMAAGLSVNLGSLATVVGTTTASGASGLTGIIVWQGNTIVVISVAASQILGTIIAVSGITGVGSISLLSTILNTIAVTQAPGLSINLGTLATAVATTTASGASGLTGILVWQGNTTVSVAGTVIVTLATAGVVTMVGIVPVSISGIVPTTTASGLSGVTGVPVWVGGGSIAISNIAASQIIGTIIAVSGITGVGSISVLSTILNTIPVSLSHPALSGVIASSVPATSVALGLPVWIVGGQTATGVALIMALSNVVLTTTGSGLSGVTGIPVWVGNATALSVSVSVSGGTNVDVTTTGVFAAGSTGMMVLVKAGSVAVSNIAASQILGTIIAVSGVTGVGSVSLLSTVLGTVAVTIVQPITKIAFMAMVSSTPAISAGTTLLFTVYTGTTLAAAGATQYAVPASKQLIINGIFGVFGSSASVGRLGQLFIQAGASGSLTSANVATVGQIAVFNLVESAIQTSGSIFGTPLAVIAAGQTMGLFFTMASSITVSTFIIQGYLEG